MTTTMVEGGFMLNRHLREAAKGNADAFFELGLAYASGDDGAAIDYVQAHKWFNLAAMSGDSRGQQCRADLAAEMSARDVAEAQRQARAWMMQTARRAA